MDANLQMMKRARMQCICGLMCNQNHSSQMASGSLWTEVTWRSQEITSKDYSIFIDEAFLGYQLGQMVEW
jgi:hypothetical protein